MYDSHFNEPPDKPPETMYKYTSFERAFDILTNGKIYFAKPSEFNDPYDGRVTLDLDTLEKRKNFMEHLERKYGTDIMSTKEKQEFIDNQSKADNHVRAIMKGWRKIDTTGFCCLTDTRHSLPMWAHYADNHKGCCLMLDFSKHSNQKSLEDDFPFHCINKIEYQLNLPKYNMDSTDSAWRYYIYKSCEWKYENEWRAVMFSKHTLRGRSRYSLHKESNGAGCYLLGDFLCGVILGYRMAKAAKKKIQVAARQRGISVQQASPKLYKYGIHLDKVDSKQPS